MARWRAALAMVTEGFLAHPMGGVIFGHFGDRVGRKSILFNTRITMRLATFLIGTLPTYEQDGLIAPTRLILLRFVQGLGVGGEWGGAVLRAVEHGHAGKRELYGSWVQAGVPIGLWLAVRGFNLCSMLPQKTFLIWGWRMPFLLGISS